MTVTFKSIEANSWIGDMDVSSNVAISAEKRLQLSADPNGVFALRTSSGTLGGLVLPARMALDRERNLYLLDGTVIRRFNRKTLRFDRLPTIGGEGNGARQLRNPSEIACCGRLLYVADTGNRRVQVFDWRNLALIHSLQHDEWEPVAVVAAGERMWIVDKANGRIWVHRPGSDRLTPFINQPRKTGCWTRPACDRNGWLYLYDSVANELDVFDTVGNPVESVQDASEIWDRFDAPMVHVDDFGRFELPPALAYDCGITPAGAEPLIFAMNGDRLENGEPLRQKPFWNRAGEWFSNTLDSEIFECQWHRIEMTIDALPSGSQVIVSTVASETRLQPATAEFASETAGLDDAFWETRYTVTAPLQPPPKRKKETGERHEFLIQNFPGRYLYVRVQLFGDGYTTPVVRDLRLHFPRESYLQHLPAVFSADDESRHFLERYLSIVQTEWDAIEQELETISRYFDPRAVPGGQPMRYLAAWLGLPLEGRWDDEQNRKLLADAPARYPKRGTLDGFRQHVATYLCNMTGISAEKLLGFPRIVEGFRERNQRMMVGESTLGAGVPLWSKSYVGRLHLNAGARLDEGRLVSTGDPRRDVFHEYAHRFRVLIPVNWIRGEEDEEMLRRAIESEKPAHTKCDLTLFQPHTRVGLQSTIGLDMVVGGYPTTRLAQRGKLGVDAVLSGTSETPFTLTESVRIGRDTTLR